MNQKVVKMLNLIDHMILDNQSLVLDMFDFLFEENQDKHVQHVELLDHLLLEEFQMVKLFSYVVLSLK